MNVLFKTLVKLGLKLGLGKKYVRAIAAVLALAATACLPQQQLDLIVQILGQLISGIVLLAVGNFNKQPDEVAKYEVINSKKK